MEALYQLAGQPAKGDFRCAECSYGIVIFRELPLCPMCGGDLWEPLDWRPLTRGRSLDAVGDRVLVGADTEL